MGRTMLVCAASALALAACSKGGDKTAAASAPAAGNAAKTASADVGGPPPSRKAGLWEQTMAFNGMKQTMRMCVDETSEQKTGWWNTERRGPSSGDPDCAERNISRTLTGGWKIHSVCKEPNGMTVTADGTASGDFGQSYHVDITTVTTGSSMPAANGTHHMVMDGAWKGACPAGMAAGDMEMPGGMRIGAHGVTGANGGAPSQAEIAKMRAQAMEMAKKYKEGSQ